MKPLVSIIIPTYNRTIYLQQALEGAMMQDYPNLEIIISDNGSIQDTRREIEQQLHDKRVRFYGNETNIGMVNNWRHSLEKYAKGEWFIILSDDDYFIDPGYVSKAIAIAIQDEKVKLVFANGFIYNEGSKEQTPLNLPFEKIEEGMHVFLKRNCYPPQHFTLVNIVFNRSATIALNGFSNPDNLACDSELFLKLCVLGKVGVVHDFVSIYRIHANNLLNTSRLNPNMFVETALGYLLEAYNFARNNRPEFEKQLKDWQQRLIRPAARSVIKELLFFHPDLLETWVDQLKKRDLFKILQLNNLVILYKTIQFILKWSPSLLVNRFGFFRNFKREISN